MIRHLVQDRYRQHDFIDGICSDEIHQCGRIHTQLFRQHHHCPTGTPGVPFARNSFRNYGYQNFDLRFLKTFAIGDRTRLQFSTEMFNIVNFDNVAINASSFGTPNTVYGPGIDPVSGTEVPARATFLRLRLPDKTYDPVNTQQGTPFQAQFGLRVIF